MNVYQVINASAGSGKTYTLVKDLLQICLTKNQPEQIRNILALTFTNKAANEMKSRILTWLRDFCSDQYEESQPLQDIFSELKKQDSAISLEKLHYRSKKLLDYILHHYSILNISTIDKFNSGLIHSFALELGLPQNYFVEIEAEPFLQEAVDQTLHKIGKDIQLSEAFLDYVNYYLDNDEKKNLQETLLQNAETYHADKHHASLKANENYGWDTYATLKEKLRSDIRELDKDSMKIAETSLDLVESNGLVVSDFSGGASNGIAVFFKKFITRQEPPFPKSEEGALATFRKEKKSNSALTNAKIEEINEVLIENRAKIIANFIEKKKKQAIHAALLPLKINSEIQNQLKIIEEENDLLLLSRFNTIINEQLRDEPSEFIYEKVGTKYSHYFFDEFQDTSILQWQNFLPLRDEALSKDGTSFTLVGDPKQSIYRFRGGDASTMLNIINQNDAQAPRQAQVKNLIYNYRSSQNIVNFNNQFTNFLSQNVGEDYHEIFGEKAQQTSKSEHLGRVRVNLFEKCTIAEFYENVVMKMQQDIQSCLDHGFEFSDIAILTRGRKEANAYANLLGQMEVKYKDQATFIKTISANGLSISSSDTVNAFIQYLKWYTFPADRQSLVLCLYYLNKSRRITMQDFSKEVLDILRFSGFEEITKIIFEKHNLNLLDSSVGLNLYNFTEQILQEFSIHGKEAEYILSMLEMLYNFFLSGGASIKDFLLYWDDKGKDKSVNASENIDAIQISTIHKSKGLEFPVVFLPMKNTNKDGEFTDWFDLENPELKKVNLKQFPSNLANYDSQMQEFNDAHSYENKIDRFCVQYVATTRPMEQLYLYIEKPTEKNNYLEIYDFVTTLPETEDSFDFFLVDEQDLYKKTKRKETSAGEKYSFSSDVERVAEKTELKIATPSKSYRETRESVKTGLFTHTVLEQIETQKDAAKVLQQYLLDGTLTQEEFGKVSDRLQILFEKHPHYFDGQYSAITEREIYYEEAGEIKSGRIDRLMDTPDGWVIIDFKTGAAREKYETQVETYT